MLSDTENLHRDFWRKTAGNIRFHVNLAQWLEILSPPLVVSSLVIAAAMLWTRREIPLTLTWVLVAIVLGLIVLLGIICLALAQQKFEQPEQ